jgi:hypothetical protein
VIFKDERRNDWKCPFLLVKIVIVRNHTSQKPVLTKVGKGAFQMSKNNRDKEEAGNLQKSRIVVRKIFEVLLLAITYA